jgi:hypothetical protein
LLAIIAYFFSYLYKYINHRKIFLNSAAVHVVIELQINTQTIFGLIASISRCCGAGNGLKSVDYVSAA